MLAQGRYVAAFSPNLLADTIRRRQARNPKLLRLPPSLKNFVPDFLVRVTGEHTPSVNPSWGRGEGRALPTPQPTPSIVDKSVLRYSQQGTAFLFLIISQVRQQANKFPLSFVAFLAGEGGEGSERGRERSVVKHNFESVSVLLIAVRP